MLDQCPRDYIGGSFVDAINLAGLCRDGVLPIKGGLLDQSAWFVDLWQTLRTDQQKIENELLSKLSVK